MFYCSSKDTTWEQIVRLEECNQITWIVCCWQFSSPLEQFLVVDHYACDEFLFFDFNLSL